MSLQFMLQNIVHVGAKIDSLLNVNKISFFRESVLKCRHHNCTRSVLSLQINFYNIDTC